MGATKADMMMLDPMQRMRFNRRLDELTSHQRPSTHGAETVNWLSWGEHAWNEYVKLIQQWKRSLK